MTVSETIEYLREHALTFSRRPGKLEVLHEMAARVETSGTPGIFVEAGVAMGGSAIIIAQTKTPERELRLYDTFEMMPPPGGGDDERSHADHTALINGELRTESERVYVAHSTDLLGFAKQNLHKFGIDPDGQNINFYKGLFADTLVVDKPVAFAHIDCDWYEPVALCLDRLADRVSEAGIVLFDDYGLYSGCRRAVHEWLSHDDRFQVIHADRTLAAQRTK
jgi:predicted O-methyltransferase YrrM